jgi:two-component sensor histidine kinase
MEPFGGRTKVDGTEVVLTSKQAQYISLALHELATNAAKYGALSNANGHVRVSWTISEGAKSAKLHFKWQESGGPLVVAPSQHGFGTALIKAIFPDAHIAYAIEGLSCEIDLLLSDNADS